MSRSMVPWFVLTCALALLVGGCASPQREQAVTPAQPQSLQDMQTVCRLATEARPAVAFRLAPAASRVLVLVDKTGKLAGLGHRHVMRVDALDGYVTLTTAGQVRGALVFPVSALVVDPPAARQGLGGAFAEHQMDENARRGTRENMLGPEVLDAARFPHVSLDITADVAAGSGSVESEVVVSLHGVTRTLPVTIAWQRTGKHLQARGRFTFRQSDFGIAPFSAAMGLLRVEDVVEVRFQLEFGRGCSFRPRTRA